MPLSAIQGRVLRLLAANRSPESYLAGATVLHQGANTPRYSLDLDYFHDLADSVASSAETDAETLEEAGHAVTWLLRAPTFYRALVQVDGESLRLEWAQDSAFRFFPVQADPVSGYRLHEADAATGKCLALAGRTEARDFVDMLHLDSAYLPLSALVWAACGKDPGYTPDLLLEHCNRHACYTQEAIDLLYLRTPLNVKALKRQWLEARQAAEALIRRLPPEEIGCLYLDAAGTPVPPDPASPQFPSLIRHFGSIRGAWPSVASHPGP
jgi:hypothetical protein